MTSRQIFLQGMRLSPESRLLEQVALLSPASHQLNSKIVIVAMDLPYEDPTCCFKFQSGVPWWNKNGSQVLCNNNPISPTWTSPNKRDRNSWIDPILYATRVCNIKIYMRVFNVERVWKQCTACQVLERAGSRIADFKAQRSWESVPPSSITM